jgi:hypothetical protein
MDITIDDCVGMVQPSLFDTVPTRVILPKIQRRTSAKQLTKVQKAAIERHQEAYKRVYGVRPEIKVKGKWYYVHGAQSGVDRNRLKAMTQQLEYRAGPV